MRIALDARYLSNEFTGIGRYSQCLIEALARLDTENEYLAIIHKSFKGQIEAGANFEIARHDARPISFGTLLRAGRVARRWRCDVYHSLFPLAPIWPPMLSLLTLHDLQPFLDPDFHGRRLRPVRWMYERFYHYVYPGSMRLAKWIIVDSEATRQSLRRFFPELAPRAIVVPLGLTAAEATPPEPEEVETVKKRYRLDAPYLLYYGSTRPNKNLARLVAAFARLRRESPEFASHQLLLITRPDRFFADALAVVERETLRANVRVIEPVSERERRALLRGARVFCFPTLYEGFGLPVLEAQAVGTPVLASTNGALPEVGGEGALYADPFSVASIADGLRRLLGDEPLRAALAEKGRLNAARFSWEESARRALDIYSIQR